MGSEMCIRDRLGTPRKGVVADELFDVATCGVVGATPVSFDMYPPRLLKDLSVSLVSLMADAKHNRLHGKRLRPRNTLRKLHRMW